MTATVSFEDYLVALAPFAPEAPGVDPEALEICERATGAIRATSGDAGELARVLAADPVMAPVLAVVDGQGWLRRQSDLRRIHGLWADRLIDGLFTRSQLDAFAAAVADAASRIGLM